MKAFLVLLISLSSFSLSASVEEACKSTLMYFDLGNTIVNTKDNSNETKYMPEAKDYLISLKDAGCTLGLIVNIPESFGKTYAEKISNLKDYVNSRWIESEPFMWNIFEAIYVPPTNADLKPAPLLFRSVQLNAWMRSKHVLYQGETPKEIAAAKKYGMDAFLVGSRSGSFFLPVQDIPNYSK